MFGERNKEKGKFNLFPEIHHHHHEKFHHCFRTSLPKFDFLPNKVTIYLNSVVLKFLQSAVALQTPKLSKCLNSSND